jgi:O-6-methylguanine DNA methyltransferase
MSKRALLCIALEVTNQERLSQIWQTPSLRHKSLTTFLNSLFTIIHAHHKISFLQNGSHRISRGNWTASTLPQYHPAPFSSETNTSKRVYALLCQIPKGRVSSYACLSKALSSSPRAVGGALRRNPFAPEVPCHRIINADGVSMLQISGRYGGYSKLTNIVVNWRIQRRATRCAIGNQSDWEVAVAEEWRCALWREGQFGWQGKVVGWFQSWVRVFRDALCIKTLLRWRVEYFSEHSLHKIQRIDSARL